MGDGRGNPSSEDTEEEDTCLSAADIERASGANGGDRFPSPRVTNGCVSNWDTVALASGSGFKHMRMNDCASSDADAGMVGALPVQHACSVCKWVSLIEK